MAEISSSSQRWKPLNSATKILAQALGILVGLAGIEHGIFEVLQGNVATSGLMIQAIGPSQRFWEHGTETALTIIPNYLVTGILAIIFGVLVTAWTIMFLDKKYGGGILLLLSIMLWLFGGGFAPIFMAIFASAIATRINKPLNWWRTHLSTNTLRFFAKLWPWSIISLVIVFVVDVEIAIFGYPWLWLMSADAAFSLQNILAVATIILWALSIPVAFAHDILQRSSEISS